MFESRFRCFFHIGKMSVLDFYPVSPIFTLSHTFFCSFPLFSGLISPRHGDPEKARAMLVWGVWDEGRNGSFALFWWGLWVSRALSDSHAFPDTIP